MTGFKPVPKIWQAGEQIIIIITNSQWDMPGQFPFDIMWFTSLFLGTDFLYVIYKYLISASVWIVHGMGMCMCGGSGYLVKIKQTPVILAWLGVCQCHKRLDAAICIEMEMMSVN